MVIEIEMLPDNGLGNTFQTFSESALKSATEIKQQPRTLISGKTRVLSLEALTPVFYRSPQDAAPLIAAYLGCLIQDQANAQTSCLLMPSLTALAKFFNVSPLEIRQAFQLLKTQGIDYMIPGYFGHITLWMDYFHQNTNAEKQ